MDNRIYYGEYSLAYWIELILTKQLILPPYQRYYVWNKQKLRTLVDSIINMRFVHPVTIGSFLKDGKRVNYIIDGQQRLTKSITLKEGKNISCQIHHHRSETWTFVQGEGIFVLDGHEQKVKVGDTVVIPVEHWHAIKALTELTFIEVQSGNSLIEENIERTEWEWGELK